MSEPLRTVRRSLDAFVDLVEVSTGRELGEDDAHAMLEPLAHAELQAIRRRHALGIWPAVTPLSPMLQDA